MPPQDVSFGSTFSFRKEKVDGREDFSDYIGEGTQQAPPTQKYQEVISLEDEKIIALYFERNEDAIVQTKAKYGKYCHKIAYNVLHNDEDAEECVNDTYLDAWKNIPPHQPKKFSVFLGTITRRIALDRFRNMTAAKRGGTETDVSLGELEECIPYGKSIDEHIEAQTIASIISKFLRKLPTAEANVFIRRYFYLESITDIADRFGFGESKTKMMLKKAREKLLKALEKEGFLI